MRLNKKLGQHFLTNFSYLHKEIKIINCYNKKILEIGGGDGRLSKQLLHSKCKELYVVEKDEKFIEYLNNYFSKNENVKILGGDFLKIKPFEIDLIVGNVPYYISSEIVFKLLEWPTNKAVLMFQKEFGLKLIAEGKNKSRLSFFSQYYFDIKKHFIIPKNAFTPPPKVDSILIEFNKKNVKKLNKKTYELITFFYQHKPKTIKASLKLYQKKINREIDITKIDNLNKRIYELSTEETLELIKKIN